MPALPTPPPHMAISLNWNFELNTFSKLMILGRKKVYQILILHFVKCGVILKFHMGYEMTLRCAWGFFTSTFFLTFNTSKSPK